MLNYKISLSATVFLLLFFALVGSCKKEVLCEPQSFELQPYTCFKQADSLYIIQNQAELDSFLNKTSSDIADCIPLLFNVDFNTQTILAYYTINCGNTLEFYLNDADEKLYYIMHQSDNPCFAAIESYNVITVPKIGNNQTVVFIRD